MPRFIKNDAVIVLDGSIEAYLLSLYGIYMPTTRSKKQPDSKMAPIMGLLGASAELLVKACLIQAKGKAIMYKENDIRSGVFKFGTEVIDTFRKLIRDEDDSISYIWSDIDNHEEQKAGILHYLGVFKLLQEERAAGLHAGIGTSRDIAVNSAQNIYNFIQLLAKSKKLQHYLRNIPSPEATVRDREAIIEDLSRRFRSSKDVKEKSAILHNMYLVLPYIPEIKPDWVAAFDRIATAPPSENDLTYLAKTLSDAHGIYMLKTRGNKNGFPVRIDAQNPEAIPIAVQNVKRELTTIQDKFNNDILSANTRITEKRLDLPHEDFLLDLYAKGLYDAGILNDITPNLTAQQTWPFVASAYSKNGIPRPCWFIIKNCAELEKLMSMLTNAESCGNGYLRRRLPEIIEAIDSLNNSRPTTIGANIDSEFVEIRSYRTAVIPIMEKAKSLFTDDFISRLSGPAITIVQAYLSKKKSAGECLKDMLETTQLTGENKQAAASLLRLCAKGEDRVGLIKALQTASMKVYHTIARKRLFFIDFIESGPRIDSGM